MPFKRKRNLLKDSKQVDALAKQTEVLTTLYMQGKITREQYEEELEKLNLYLDLRQLAVELQVT